MLTTKQVNGLSPKQAVYEVKDGGVRGLRLRVSPRGTKSYVLHYQLSGKQRRMVIGRVGELSLAEARSKAEEIRGQARDDRDPKAKTGGPSKEFRFDRLVDEFIERHAKVNTKARSASEAERILKKCWVGHFEDRNIREIERFEIHAPIDERLDLGQQTAARLAFAHLRKFFNWCVERGYLDHSPCWGMKGPARAEKRKRVLSDEEIKKVWLAADELGYPFGLIVQLLMLTGKRRNEVATGHWADITSEKDIWVLPRDRTKTSIIHEIPITAGIAKKLIEIPRRDEVLLFPSMRSDGTGAVGGFSRAKSRLDKLVKIEDFRIHDLRRTMRTRLSMLGFPKELGRRILGHAQPSGSEIDEIYDRYNYMDEMRQALEAYEGHVMAIVDQAP